MFSPPPFVSSEVETRHANAGPVSFWAYLLRCADGKYYTGHTDDLERRLGQHQHGGFCDFTSRRRPVVLMWCQEFTTRAEALGAELQVKAWSRAKKEALAAQDWNTLSYFAIPPHERDPLALGRVARPDREAVSASLDTNGGDAQKTEKGQKP